MVSLLRGQLPSARKIQTKHFSQLSPSLLYPQRYICRPWVMRTSTQLGFLFFSSSSCQVTKHEDSTRCINTGHQCIFLPLQKKKLWSQLHFYFIQSCSHDCYLSPTLMAVGFEQLCLQVSSWLSNSVLARHRLFICQIRWSKIKDKSKTSSMLNHCIGANSKEEILPRRKIPTTFNRKVRWKTTCFTS